MTRHRQLLVPLFVLLAAASRPDARQGPGRQAATAPGQQIPPVTFKVEINYVEVDAVVVDQNGQFVRTLAKDEFQILEDGKPQTVSAFGLVDIPVERAEAPLFVTRAIEPDVGTNASGLDGRLYLIVLDDLHTAALRSQWVRRAARRFIEHDLGANDLAAVVATGGRTDNSQDFTSNQRLLLSAVDRFMGNSIPSATASMLDDYNRQLNRGMTPSRSTVRDTDEQHRAYNARRSLDTLRRAADFLSGVRGRRKALIFISEGIDYDVTDPFNNMSATDIMAATRDAIAAATRANVSFYTVDPRGLTTLADAIDTPAPPLDPTLGLGTEGAQRELRLSQDSLRVLAEETGGFAALNSNDFTRAFTRIRQENSTYYVLGYYPTNDRRDGGFRRIDVRVTRPGLTVRARRGYAAPRGKPSAARVLEIKEEVSPAVKEALSSPVPVTGLRLSVFAAPFKGKAPDASVLVVVQADGDALRLVEKNGTFMDTLELAMLALDAEGKVRAGGRQLLNLTLKPDTRAAIGRAGVRVMDRLTLRPGRYQLRVVAADSAPGVVGSVHYDLEIPDFGSAPISMSGLVLTSSRAAETPSGNMDAEIKQMLPGPPTTRRVFSAGEELALVAEVYDTQGSTPHKVDIVTTIQSDDGRVLFTHADERSSNELGGASGGFGYTTRVPLKGMAPGLYLLKVEARSRLGPATVASRELQFRIQ